MQLTIQNLLPTYFSEDKKQHSGIWGKELSFNAGSLIHIVAPSGSGKTSLMHFLYGLRNEYNGIIQYNNRNLKTYTAEDFAQLRKENVSIVFQDLRLFPEQTIRENLEIKRQLNPHHPISKIDEYAERLGIAHKLNTKAKICSYGEQQRTAIIRALLQPFSFLLLDEPFSHLDNNNAEKAMQLIIEECKEQNASIIYADLEKSDAISYDKILHL